MYTTVQSPRRWNSVAPWICILLLSLILFAIAATIIISLIAIYLPTRNVTPATSMSSPQTITIPLSSSSSVGTGSASDSVRSSTQSQLQSALQSSSSASKASSVTVNSVQGNAGGKRKRQNGQVIATSITIIYQIIFTKFCTTPFCQTTVTNLLNELFKGLSLTITDPNFTTITSTSAQASSTISTTQAANTSNTTTITTTTTKASTTSSGSLVSDIDTISKYWGNLRPYADNPPNFFTVKNTGLPQGCQVEQVTVIHRHAARYPSSADNTEILHVIAKLKNTTGTYTGPLSFLNTYQYQLGADLLVPIGTQMAYQSGVDFWTIYGRILYNAQSGQNYYNATGQTTPVIRANTISRVTDTAVAWAEGFFALYNTTTKYTLVRIPAQVGFNNSLASYFSCVNFISNKYGIYNINTALYIPIDNYIESAVSRLDQYAPDDVSLTEEDVFIMQELCPYEYSVFNQSDFCSLFTLDEWKGFAYTFDLFTLYGFGYQSYAARAMGLGVLQEILARLQNQVITVGNSSINTTYDGDSNLFPTNQKFYFDATHDFMIVSALVAMSLDYFRTNYTYNSFPPDDNRVFQTSYIIPYASRLVVEKIGCVSSNPTETNSTATQYTPTGYGYSSASATNKFVRMRLNNGILPLSTIRGGLCSGRNDGLCSLTNFVASQANATTMANYQQICFGNFTYNASKFDNDGTYFP